MYKVSDVSSMLGVEKTEIIAKMISHKHLLESNIEKLEGVTYFNDKALDILRTLFNIKVSEQDQVEKDYLEPVRSKQLSRHDKEYNVIKDKISILANELNHLDEELLLKDQLIQKYHEKLLEEIDLMNKIQGQLLKTI